MSTEIEKSSNKLLEMMKSEERFEAHYVEQLQKEKEETNQRTIREYQWFVFALKVVARLSFTATIWRGMAFLEKIGVQIPLMF